MMLSRAAALAFLDEMEKIAGKRTDEVLHALTVSLRKPATEEHLRGWSRHAALNAGIAKEEAGKALEERLVGSPALAGEHGKESLKSAIFAVLPPNHHKPGDLAGMVANDGGHRDYFRYGDGRAPAPGSRGWWLINKKGVPDDQKKLWSQRPWDANPKNGDEYTPYGMTESHAHKDGGVHVGPNMTLAEARAELARVKAGTSGLKKVGADLTLYHASTRPDLKEIEPRLDPRTGEKAIFAKTYKEGTAPFALAGQSSYGNISHSTKAGKFTSGKAEVRKQLAEEGWIYEIHVPSGKAEKHSENTYLLREKATPSAVHKITRQEAEAMGWKFEKKAEYAKGLPDKKKTSPVRLVEKPEHWRMVLQHHPAMKAGAHHDLRLNDPAPGGVSHSWATKKDWPKPGERIRLFQQPDHKPSYSDFQGHLLSGYGKTKPGSKGVQKVMDERVEIKRTSDKLIRFDVFRKEGELPDRYVLVKAKHDGKGHPPWVLINHGKAKADQAPVK